jgi:hypothetical protein
MNFGFLSQDRSCKKFRIRLEAVAASGPARARGRRRVPRRDALSRHHLTPSAGLLLERRIIHFAHSRIDARDDSRLAGFLGNRLEGGNRDHGQIAREREALGEAACNPQARE